MGNSKLSVNYAATSTLHLDISSLYLSLSLFLLVSLCTLSFSSPLARFCTSLRCITLRCLCFRLSAGRWGETENKTQKKKNFYYIHVPQRKHCYCNNNTTTHSLHKTRMSEQWQMRHLNNKFFFFLYEE